MNPEGDEKGARRIQDIRRILVAIDASPASMAALHAAAELACQLNAELVGLFVEDINLLRMAELPFAQRISVYSVTQHSIDREKIEQEMRAQANAARRALAEMARQRRLRSSFRVSRGVIPNELIQASIDTDLIILGKTGWSRRKRVGSTTRTVIAQSASHILVLQQAYRARSILGMIYDGTPGAEKTLGFAAGLMSGRQEAISVLILADSVEQAQDYQGQVGPWALENELEARYRWLVGLDRSRLADLARNENYQALIVSSDCASLCGEALETFIEDTNIPVFLVH
jgi:nucleotide-binding universal stress UspA family protein